MRFDFRTLALSCVVVTTLGAEEPTQRTLSDADRARTAFQDVARKLYEEILPSLREETLQDLERVLGCDGKDCAAKAAEFLVATSEALAVTPEDARRILLGQFEDSSNSNTVQSCAKRLRTFGVALPHLFTHLIEKVLSKKIERGIELEFAARLLAYHTARVQRLANASATGR